MNLAKICAPLLLSFLACGSDDPPGSGGAAGSGAAGAGTAGAGTAGTGTAGNGTAGTGTAGSSTAGAAGSGSSGTAGAAGSGASGTAGTAGSDGAGAAGATGNGSGGAAPVGGAAGAATAGAAGASAGAAGAASEAVACSCDQNAGSTHGCVFYPEGMTNVATTCAGLPASCQAKGQTFSAGPRPQGDTLVGCCYRTTLDAAMSPSIGNCLYRTSKTTAAQAKAYIDSQCAGAGNTWKPGPGAFLSTSWTDRVQAPRTTTRSSLPLIRLPRSSLRRPAEPPR